MRQARVLMIGLDAFEHGWARRLIDAGRLPALARIERSAACFLLDHGTARRTGLAWEHASTGLSPATLDRWSAVDFDPARYTVIQRPTFQPPFAAALRARTVVFDMPGCALANAPQVEGMVGWGAHDSGIVSAARPDGIAGEIAARFGAYPALKWMYGLSWPSAGRTRDMAQALVRAIEARAQIVEWLLAERLAGWDLAMVAIGEFHSAIEAFWHGVDPHHPLHGHPSAEPARQGLEAIYVAADRMIGRLMERFPDVRLVLFNLDGMGANDGDAASMLLLPELLYRSHFGKAHLRRREWPAVDAGIPLLTEDMVWETEIMRLVRPAFVPWRLSRAWSAARRRLRPIAPGHQGLDWMPASHYRRFWRHMPAFALPAFLDGRIRINLKGRERHGIVESQAFEAVCRSIEALLRECRDVVTGRDAVATVDRPASIARARGPSEADMTVAWNSAPLGLVHPVLGQIGPVPYRRTGGHTGRHGIAYFQGAGIGPGHHGMADGFDVMPTVVDMLGEPRQPQMEGISLLARMSESPAPLQVSGAGSFPKRDGEAREQLASTDRCL